MVKLVRNQVNRIPVNVTATIDYTGYSATLHVAGANKSLANLKAANLRLEFTPAEVEEIGEGAEGLITVLNSKGEIHCNTRVWFGAVDTATAAAGYQKIQVVLVSMLKYEGSRRVTPADGGSSGGGGSGDGTRYATYDELVAERVARVNGDDATLTSAKQYTEDTVVAFAEDSDSDTVAGKANIAYNQVTNIITPRVEIVEEKVETVETKVTNVESVIDEELKPRVEKVEADLERKLELDDSDSDDENFVLVTRDAKITIPKETDDSETAEG